jgi:hypothetical protein
MNDETANKVHWSFWLIGAVVLIWNVLGSINFFVQMNPDMIAAYPESEQAIIVGRPTWATVAFAVAVLGGSFGSVLLLLRKSAAFYLFVPSLLGVIVAMTHALGLFGPSIEFSAAEMAGTILMPLVLATFMVWYTKYAENRTWIR